MHRITRRPAGPPERTRALGRAPLFAALFALGCSNGLTPMGPGGGVGDTDGPPSPPTPGDTDLPVAQPNRAPTAEAGPDQFTSSGAIIYLDGSGSTDPDDDVLNYLWVMQSRPQGWSGEIANGTRVNPTFYADVAGTYVVELQVDDGEYAASDTVSVTVEQTNGVPVANAGNDQYVDVGDVVHLNGSASYDPDPGDSLTYAWTMTTRPGNSSASLGSATSPLPTFTADAAGVYLIDLVVTDSRGASSAVDSVRVTAQSDDGGGDSGGCFSCVAAAHQLRSRAAVPAFLLFPLLVAGLRRRG